MSGTFKLYGTTVRETFPDDPAAIGIAVDVGGGRIVRPPASLKALIDKIGSGEPVQLTSDELDNLNGMGIELTDASLEAHKAESLRQLAAGVPRDVINAQDVQKRYRAAKPIKIVAAFRAI